MKTTFLITLFFLLNNFVGEQTVERNLHLKDIKEIQIKYVDFDLESPYRIDCTKFNDFGKLINVKKVRKEKTIAEIISFLNKAPKNKTGADLDARFTMKLKNSNGETQMVCGNETFIEIENEQFLVSKEFGEYLNKLLK